MATPALSPAARASILAWFDAGGRAFPFRGIDDPYAILVSETMAQQTQIARATEKWAAFLARFPTVGALANAAPADVLRAWRGLGYNRRALNLLRAARIMVSEHGGQVPKELAALERLPGVGAYTARAVAALAFGQAVGPVDTNVRRVLGRIVGGSQQPDPRALQAIADRAVPPDRPADWTHALMDVGATLCRPVRPRCADCPARAWCRFAAVVVAEPPGPASQRSQRLPFASTTRWLRGRLIDRLRDAPDDGWTEFSGPLGIHGADAIAKSLEGMAREGLVELHQSDRLQARLPVA